MPIFTGRTVKTQNFPLDSLSLETILKLYIILYYFILYFIYFIFLWVLDFLWGFLLPSSHLTYLLQPLNDLGSSGLVVWFDMWWLMHWLVTITRQLFYVCLLPNRVPAAAADAPFFTNRVWLLQETEREKAKEKDNIERGRNKTKVGECRGGFIAHRCEAFLILPWNALHNICRCTGRQWEKEKRE